MADRSKDGDRPEAGTGRSSGAADENAREARRILERVGRESETVGTSSMVRGADQSRRMGDPAEPASGDNEDPIEVLGRRIGRGLGFVALAALVLYLAVTYVLR